jgi:NADH-quinone oxidoreductase subunit J
MVYAGAIMMLVTFVIMVLNGAKDKRTPMFDGVSFFIIPAVIVLAAMVGFALTRAPFAFDSATVVGSVKVTSETLFNMASTGPGYFLLFEIIGVLLLSAMVAAIFLAKRHLGSVITDNTEEKH